jgi:hypothetical protein
MKRIVLFSFFAILLFSSCSYVGGKRIRGDGNVISQDRTVGQFNNVDVSGAIDVYIKQDSAQPGVKVEADANLQELVEVYEQNGTLYISPRDHYNLRPSKAIKVFVSAPRYRRLDVSGASNIFSENKIVSTESLDIDISGASGIKIDLKAPRVNTEVTGASKAVLTGETRDFNVEGTGASDVKCFDLKTENTTLGISGACSAEVFASVKLDVDASGASGVRYKGSPAVTQDLSGASSLKKVD